MLAYTVTTVFDIVDANDGVLSLREAIAAANATPAADTIDFAPALTNGGPARMILTQNALKPGGTLTIIGPTDNTLTIDASGSDPTPNVIKHDGSAAFITQATFGTTPYLEIRNLRITGADYNFRGGAIDGETTSRVVLRNVTIDHNAAVGNGGGVFVDGTAEIYDSILSDNKVAGGGGGISVFGTLTVSNSLVTRNTSTSVGGGIDNYRGSLTVLNSEISSNTGSNGGGIQCASTVTIQNSVIKDNQAINSYYGGGGIFIHNVGIPKTTLTITSSTISGNSCTFGSSTNNLQGGGGIFDETRYEVVITNCVITSNRAIGSTNANGGGILTASFFATITGSLVEDNECSGPGGGIATGASSANLGIDGSTIVSNRSGGAGGGIYSQYCDISVNDSVVSNNLAIGAGGGVRGGTITVNGSVVLNNQAVGAGGGIYSSENAEITDSTVAENSTSGANGKGGGIYVYMHLKVQNSTISGNTTVGSTSHGAGAYGRGLVSLYNSTVVNNRALDNTSIGGGFFQDVNLSMNSIIAGNAAGGGNPDVRNVTAAKYSIIGDKSGTALVESQTPNSFGTRIGNSAGGGVIDPRLGSLALNGGTAPTHVPLPGSPAINAGIAGAVTGVNGIPLFDERGAPWSRIAGGRIDIGAVELQANPLAGDYNFNGVVDAADYVVWRKSNGSTTNLRADGDGNGTVESADYDFWRARFGQTSGSAVGESLKSRSLNLATAATVAVAETAKATTTDKAVRLSAFPAASMAPRSDGQRAAPKRATTVSNRVAGTATRDEAIDAWWASRHFDSEFGKNESIESRDSGANVDKAEADTPTAAIDLAFSLPCVAL